MPSKYLTLFQIGVDLSYLEDKATNRIAVENIGRDRSIDRVIRGNCCAFSVFVSRELYGHKVSFGDPPFNVVTVGLSRQPEDIPTIVEKIALWAYIDYDPDRLLDLPPDNKVIGETCIALVEKGLEKLENWPDFPTQLVRDACEKFRALDYTTHYRAFERNIPGTKIKGRIDVYMSCVATWRILSIVYRGKTLLCKNIGETDAGEWHFSSQFWGFELDGDILTFHSRHIEMLEWDRELLGDKTHPFLEPVCIDLKDFPEAYEILTEKGLLKS